MIATELEEAKPNEEVENINPVVATIMPSLEADRIETKPDESEVTRSENDRMKNLASAVILLAGMFVGSIFVDLGQLISQEGFSPRAVRENTILEAAGKTWVAYADPKVTVRVITESGCAACAPDEALVWLRRILPTMEASPVEAGTDQGKALVETFGITTLPAFIFSKEVESTDFYSVAAEIFAEKEGEYLLDTGRLGLKPGKFLALPEIRDDSIVIGSRDAKVKIIEFSDFQCPYCKTFHASVRQMLDEYGNEVAYVYKHLPLSFHPQAENAALASECANEQGKFAPYMDTLFEKQAEWGNTKGTQKFKEYARRLGLKADFNACLDNKKYADKVAADTEEAAKFGVDGTPGVFVGDEFFAGAVQYPELKSVIDGQMAK
jgi:predicted DsbA family dithiol-disulfide isomerase